MARWGHDISSSFRLQLCEKFAFNNAVDFLKCIFISRKCIKQTFTNDCLIYLLLKYGSTSNKLKS